MGVRTGSADLPLHGGRVPQWLGERMSRLGRVLVEAIVHHYGRDELLRRLAHPFWFQSLGAVMGMDWHSSGITTSVVGALKRGLAPVEWELGLHVCGGRGRHSRHTPAELLAVGERLGLDGDALGTTSRLVAKVDSAAVQDGFGLYLHAFVVADDGRWVVVQQGMSPERRQARRYHWLSEGVRSFVEEPHAAIEGRPQGAIVNLTDRRAAPSRDAQLDLLRAGPDRVVETLARARGGGPAPALPHLGLPAHHDVTGGDVELRRLHATLAAAADRGPRDFSDLLLVPGVGPRTVLSLALVAEVIHGAPCRFGDPARFSLAHGGKDGHPFPVPLRVYDETIRVMRQAVDGARLGNDDRLAAIRRLDEAARRLERAAIGPSPGDAGELPLADGGFGGRGSRPDVRTWRSEVRNPSPAACGGTPTAFPVTLLDAFLAGERRAAPALGGRTVLARIIDERSPLAGCRPTPCRYGLSFDRGSPRRYPGRFVLARESSGLDGRTQRPPAARPARGAQLELPGLRATGRRP